MFDSQSWSEKYQYFGDEDGDGDETVSDWEIL